METLKVTTIYPAFMGEVNHYGIGAPCTFVRLAGCNLRCYHKTKGTLCDTPESLVMSCGVDMRVSHVLDEVRQFGNNLVCLTGGEPLMQNVRELLTELSNKGYHVVVETNGSKGIALYRHIRNVSFVVDVKSISSGESERMLEDNYELLDENDFIKFVVDTEEDYRGFEQWVFSHDYVRCKVAIGTFWGSELSYSWLVKALKHTAFPYPIYVNMQTHKMMCLYDKSRCGKEFNDLFIPKDL